MTSKLIAGLSGITFMLAAVGEAVAADLPVGIPVIDPAPVASVWTGFYLGGQLGYALVDEPFDEVEFAPYVALGYTVDVDDNSDGFEAGAYVGADIQLGSFVLGALADINYIDSSVSIIATSGTGSVDFDGTDSLNWYGGVRGRAGYALGQLLPYLHGGLAFGDYQMENAGPVAPYDESAIQLGYGVGAGVEALLLSNVSVKAEYQYTDLGETDFAISDGVGGTLPESSISFSSIRLGAAYRF